MDISRRRAIRNVALAAIACLELSRAGPLSLIADYHERVARQQRQAQYQSLCQVLTTAGESINEARSIFHPDARTTIVFLPDIHVPLYQRLQRSRILKLDARIQFDAIGLEGIAGEVDHEAIRRNEGVLQPLFAQELIPIFDGNTATIEPSDSPLMRLQKQRKILAVELDQFHRIPQAQEDYCNDAKLHQLILETDLALGRLNVHVPARELCRSVAWNDRTPFFLENPIRQLTQSHRPRYDAPGIPYHDLETRASHWGMEDIQHDDYAIRLAHSADILHKGKVVETDLLAFVQAYNAMKGQCPYVTATLDQTVNDYVTQVQQGLQEAQTYAQGLVSDIAQEDQIQYINASDDQAPDEILERVVTAQRSADWVVSSHGTVFMMIGGLAHTDSIYHAAQSRGKNLITLGELEH